MRGENFPRGLFFAGGGGYFLGVFFRRGYFPGGGVNTGHPFRERGNWQFKHNQSPEPYPRFFSVGVLHKIFFFGGGGVTKKNKKCVYMHFCYVFMSQKNTSEAWGSNS